MSIVAAIDGTRSEDPTVSAGYDLARAFDETLILLHVVPEEEFDAHLKEILPDDRRADYSFTQEERSAARLAADVLETSLPEHDPDAVETVGRIGDPAREILAVADERDARYVVVGGRRRSPVGKAMFGSITQEVLLGADRPVVTVMSD